VIKVLHLTPHLGGGVGKAIAGICEHSTVDVTHTIICLENPEKNFYIEFLNAININVVINPSHERLLELVRESDIIQVEWWNHPGLIEKLISLSGIPIRLVVWSHISGLFNPIIPHELIRSANKFILTSSCSLDVPVIKEIMNEFPEKVSVISSGGGLAGIANNHEKSYSPIKAGYIGTLNFSKLHPQYVEFIATVNDEIFSVSMYGDLEGSDALMQKAEEKKRPHLLKTHGFNSDVDLILNELNVFAYLLNPYHFGTAENALLEAMAAGVVPLVLDNPAELSIVTHKRNGLVIHSPEEFGTAIQWLSNNPIALEKMGKAASKDVKEKYTYKNSNQAFEKTYDSVLHLKKDKINFLSIFGSKPSEWFLSCRSNDGVFKENGVVLLPQKSDNAYFGLVQKTKGSVRHFSRHFKEDIDLMRWNNYIENML
jgi:L-malate glycosyltransferase